MELAKNCLVSAALLSALAGAAFGQCTSVEKLTTGSPANTDNFGASLAFSFGGPSNATLLAVGMPNEDAPVSGADAGGYTIYQKINGWSVLASAWNTTGQAGERMGASIDLADPYLIVGCPGYNTNTGRARIYTRSGSSYLHSDDALAYFPNQGDEMGAAVGISAYGGGWAIIGAPGHYFHGLSQSGAAFIYTRAANGVWSEAWHIWGGDYGGDVNERRGTSVSMSQSTRYAAVGAPNGENSGQPADHGIVHVIQRLDNGLPTLDQNLAPPSPEAGEHFGASVAIENNWLVVGAPDEDLTLQESGFIQAATNGGAIYIFERGASTWNFVAKLRAPVPTAGGQFGAQVATDGGLQILVSEPGTKRVHIFSSISGAWAHQASISDQDPAAAGLFGSSVGVRNGEIAVGDTADDHNGFTDAGAVYSMNMEHDIPSGDLCSDPLPLPSSNYNGCTEFATSSGNLGGCGTGGAGQGNDVWFEFTPQCSGNAIIDTYGSAFDTVLSVHSTCPTIFADNTIVCNDDASFPSPNNRASLVTFNFEAGQTYLVRVSGYNGAKGAFTLRPSFYYSVNNDTCATATTIGLGTVSFNNCAATTAPGTAYCANSFNRDVWYRYIAPSAGLVEFTTCGSSFDTVMAVYNGTQQNCPANGSEIACSDDVGPGQSCEQLSSRVVVNAAAGQSFMVRVGGFGPSNFGNGSLTVQPYSPCGASDFDGDGDVGTDADIEAFFACLGGNCCQTCGTADFDGDGDVGTDADIEAFFRVLGGGNC